VLVELSRVNAVTRTDPVKVFPRQPSCQYNIRP